MAVRDFSVSACLSHPRTNLLSQTVNHCYMSRLMTKRTKWYMHPANTQISLGIRPVWSESSLSAWRKLGSFASISNSKFIHFSGYTITYNYMRCNTISNILVATHWTHSEDSDQTGRMPDWSESSLGAQSFCWFGSFWGGSYIDAQELLLPHMISGCNCIGKHFVETKKQFVEVFRTFTVFYFLFIYFFFIYFFFFYLFFFFFGRKNSTRIWTESVSCHHQE